MTPVSDIAETILEGFDRHYRLFREISTAARGRFENVDWAGAADANRERVQMYDLRVWEAVSALNAAFPEAEHDESLWPAIKLSYIGMLYEHLSPELAETFFNSVARRVLHEKILRPWSTFVKYIG